MTETPPNIREVIRRAKLPIVSIPVCLAGDLIADINELYARSVEPRLLGLMPESQRKRAVSQNKGVYKQIEDLRKQMSDATVELRLQARSKDRWRELVEKYPPRKNNKADAEAGVNVERFVDTVLRESFVNDGLEDADICDLFKVLPAGEFERLTGAMWALNRGAVVIPKSPAELVEPQTSDDD